MRAIETAKNLDITTKLFVVFEYANVQTIQEAFKIADEMASTYYLDSEVISLFNEYKKSIY